jgi:hypothetical protein
MAILVQVTHVMEVLVLGYLANASIVLTIANVRLAKTLITASVVA